MPLDDALAHTQALIRCPSVTPAEAGALAYLETQLAGLGFVCHRLPFSADGTPDVDNLYARFGTRAPHVSFAGHTDVVPVGLESDWTHPPFAAEVHDGVLFGRGAADMKGGIGCFLAAAARWIGDHGGPERAAEKGSISLLITGDEEGPSINGTVRMLQWLESKGERIDHCIVGEPTNPAQIGDAIKIGRRGSLNGEIAIVGKQGHVAYQHLADNPITGLARVIEAVLAEPLDAGTADFMPSNLEFTNLEVGNAAVNVIPARAKARFNVRFNDAWDGPKLEALIRARTQRALEGTRLRAELSFSLSGDSFVTRNDRLVATLSRAIETVTGLTPELSTSGGTSDARFIKNHCPVVEFGLVNATIHQVDEQVPVVHLQQLTAVYLEFLRGYFPGTAGS